VLVVIARDWRETLVFAFTKKAYTSIPDQAEVKAILWTVLLAKDLNLVEVEVESKSKSCIDALVLRSVVNSQHYS